ncbi:Clp1/GlmU family protein [Thermococcus nautili]|uniref:polynucleotide 5'-hydroxyl-kinase n=1 Tax=Thermococcus nautili TaxID=195522 RepID=W8NWP5_9EURY|nr:Clp1/GlmU family protein [Thermococcus nautili]AHL23637.1 putative GTPase or GTP-binding protein [Thermococcus nautili]
MNKAIYTRDVPPDRLELLAELSSRDAVKVMVIGGLDAGKSTLVTFLANELLSLGRSVAVVDSDVGQKGILPPATISLALPDENFSSLSELEGVAHYFIGTVSPSQFTGEMAVGVKRLVELAERSAEIVLIDTTGFVTGPGFEMKRLKAELVRPDLIVLLERNGELDSLARALSPYGEVVRLTVSENAKAVAREERREIRFEKWRTYFSNARLAEFSLSEVTLTGTSLFTGRPLDEREKTLLSRAFRWLVLAGWENEGRYTVVKADEESFPRGYRSIHAVDFERLSNLLVGLLDGDGLCLGLGILKWVNFSAETLQLLTPLDEVALGEVRELRFGRMRVLETGEELGLMRRDEL